MRSHRRNLFRTCTLTITLIALAAAGSCTSTTRFILHGGTVEHEHPKRPAATSVEPHVLIFAFDGAGYDQLMHAISSGNAPHMAALLGKDQGKGVYAH